LDAGYNLARWLGRDASDAEDVVRALVDPLAEDAIRRALGDWLRSEGWEAQIRWSQERGIDVEAQRGDQRWTPRCLVCNCALHAALGKTVKYSSRRWQILRLGLSHGRVELQVACRRTDQERQCGRLGQMMKSVPA
jgi:hypothetical protein